MMINNETLALRIGDITFTNNGFSKYKIISINSGISRHIQVLSWVCDIKVHLPLKDFMSQSFIIPSQPQTKARLSIYPTLENAQNNQNETILIDGFIYKIRFDVTAQSVSLDLKVGDKTALLEQQYIDASLEYSEDNFNQHLHSVLEGNGLKTVIKNIIYARRGIQFVNDTFNNSVNVDIVPDDIFNDIKLDEENERRISPHQTVANYLESLCNEAQVMLTTNIYNNKEYLYCLDTSQVAVGFARKDYDKAGFRSDQIQTIHFNYLANNTIPLILQSSFEADFTKIYNEIHIHQNQTEENYGELGEITKKTITNTTNRLAYDLTKDSLVKLRFSFEMRENKNGLLSSDYADYLIRQLMSQYLTIQFEVKGFYCNDNANPFKLIPWQLAAPIAIDSDIFNKIGIFTNEKMYKARDKFILAGYSLNYNVSDGLKTMLYLMPNSFPFSEKN